MPDGVLQWFDERSGEGAVARGGRTYLVRAGDLDPAARRAGARVHFDILRDQGVERAVDVVLRSGTRTGHRHARVGTLAGARRADEKSEIGYHRAHPEEIAVGPEHPFEVVRAWADALSRAERDVAASLCSPEVRVHLPGHDLVGRRQLGGWLQRHPALGCRRPVVLRGSDGDVEARWRRTGSTVALPGARCRVAHGWIVELWPIEPLEAREQVPFAEGGRGLAIETVVGAEVQPDEVRYAEERLVRAAETVADAVTFARLKLAVAGDPARPRPARAEIVLDLSGEVVRATVRAGTVREAADLLADRLREQLRHRGERRAALHRSTGRAEPGEWRHGALAPRRPDHFVRPVEERQLVRLKSVATEDRTPDEAVLDMEQLDYDFYLFRDATTGADSLVERTPEGPVLLSQVGGAKELPGGAAPLVERSPRTPPRLVLEEAIEQLNLSGEPYVFYEDAQSGRGSVCYVRYDGHYGLVSLEGPSSGKGA